MKWTIGLLLTTLCVAHSFPTSTTTPRSTSSVGNTTKKNVNQLGENAAILDMMHDIRTPPKVKQQVQDKMKIKNEFESSHAGVAIPIDEDSLEMEETTKKLNFYKIERPTTNSGLSTWILLSGQASTTTKPPPTRKPVIKATTEGKLQQNLTAVASDKPTRVIKPIFKQRPSSTQKPITTTQPTTTTVNNTIKLTKIKASTLNNATNKKSNITVDNTTKKFIVSSTTTGKPIPTTHLIAKKNNSSEDTTVSSINSSALPLESKDDEVDLPITDNKKTKSTNKKKKNKTRRRKPVEKDNNSTSVSKPTKNNKQNPISTQLYNYLAREIMPTVGVGLVGLMVTAGLAGYFLYPFGPVRRSYEIDRKDKVGSYYYKDEYSGGMPEEEAIGKVIAGMPENSFFTNNYKTPTSRNAFLNTKYRFADRTAQIKRNPYGGMVQGTVEDVPLASNPEKDTIYDQTSYQSGNYEPISYSSDLNSRYSPMIDQKFVVGSIPKEIATEVTPAAVPEHGPRNLNMEYNYAEEPIFVVGNPPEVLIRDKGSGPVPVQMPRSLKIRRKRSDFPNDIDNEIVSSFDSEVITTGNPETTINDATTLSPDLDTSSSTTEKPEITTTNTQTTTDLPDKIGTFIDLMKDLIHLKAKIGLQIIQNATQSISNYISRVQTRLDQHYRGIIAK